MEFDNKNEILDINSLEIWFSKAIKKKDVHSSKKK